VKRDASHGLTTLERDTISRIHQLVYSEPDEFYRDHGQHPESTLGLATGGGTAANLTALWIARERSLPEGDGFDGIERLGLGAALAHYDYAGAVIVGSE